MTLNKTVVVDQETKTQWAYAHNPDCTVTNVPIIRLIEPRVHGTVRIVPSLEYSNYPSTNQRYPCNLKPSKANAVFYKPQQGFAGRDAYKVEIIWPWGATTIQTHNITVK